jgi:hypothetical protein
MTSENRGSSSSSSSSSVCDEILHNQFRGCCDRMRGGGGGDWATFFLSPSSPSQKKDKNTGDSARFLVRLSIPGRKDSLPIEFMAQ